MQRVGNYVVASLFLALVAAIAVNAGAQNQKPDPLKGAPRAPSSGGQPWSIVTTQPSYPSYGGYGGWGGGWGGGGGTVAGDYLQGMASAVRAAGDYNLSTSQAYVNLEEAKRRDIVNRQAWTDAYFEMRRTNAAYRQVERGPKGTPDEWVRYAKEAAPARLSPGELDSVSGEINWPRILQRPEFKDGRDELERLYSHRAERGGSIGPGTYTEIQSSIAAMTDFLKSNIKKYPPNEYLDAKKFLESLAYEARFATG